MAWYSVLHSVLCVPSFCQFGNIVSVGLWFSHPGPPLFLFFLFVQQPIVNSHSKKQEDAGDNKEDSTALVRVLVIMIDVLKLSCMDKNHIVNSILMYIFYICESKVNLCLTE